MPPDPTARASGISLHSLVLDYGTWRARFPEVIPRRVHISSECWQNPNRADYGDGLAATVKEIALGHDLSPRLSTGVLHTHELVAPLKLVSRPGRQRKDRDLLLSDWGIHHLHLGTERSKHPAFVERKPHVLFVAFRGLDAYVIDLRAHEPEDNWAELRILEIAIRNWPDAEIVHRPQHVSGIVGGNVSDEDRRALREARVNTGVESDGEVYMPLGQSLDGAPMLVTHHAMKVSWILRVLRDDPDEPTRTLNERAAEWGLDPGDWHPTVHADHFGFVNGGVFVPYGSLVR